MLQAIPTPTQVTFPLPFHLAFSASKAALEAVSKNELSVTHLSQLDVLSKTKRFPWAVGMACEP